jgi:hypothetical protein
MTPYMSYFASLCINLIIQACIYICGMSNNRQLIVASLLVVTLVLSLTTIALTQQDAQAGKYGQKRDPCRSANTGCQSTTSGSQTTANNIGSGNSIGNRN